MFLLQISLAILALLLLLAGIRHLDRYTARRFGNRFFALLPLVGHALSFGASYSLKSRYAAVRRSCVPMGDCGGQLVRLSHGLARAKS